MSMLQKKPETRITLDKIKEHPWVTNFGQVLLLSAEENCVFEPLTEDEVESAMKPAMVFISKVSKVSLFPVSHKKAFGLF